MKVFVALTCLLAVASASLIASPHSVLLQPQHLPVIDANGVPVEPLVNQAARVQHAQLRAAAQIRNGDAALLGAPLALAAAHGIAAPAAIAGLASPLALSAHGAILAAPQHLPAIDGNGVPVEPLANQIARAQNAAAHANAQLRNGDLHSILGRKKRSLIAAAWAAPQHLPIIDSNGVPVEPLVNQATRVQHAQLRAAAQIRNGDVALLGAPALALGAHGLALGAPAAIAAAGPLALAGLGAIYGAPLLDANSVPIEPLANQIVRAQNVAAHVNANIRTGDLHGVLGRKKRSVLAAPWAAAAYAVPQHLPIIDSNGVPVEPLVNQAARVQHAQLRAAAQIRNGDVALLGAPALALGAHGLALGVPAAIAAPGLAVAGIPALAGISHAGRVPIDTPDVAAVRAAHLATKIGHGLW